MGNEHFIEAILAKQNNAFLASISERHFHLSSTNSLISLLDVGSLCQENTSRRHFIIIVTQSFERMLST